tara:strand:- start:1449 stop:1931 length:483 start_codon:yes stop_codon:yes gene_type:complete
LTNLKEAMLKIAFSNISDTMSELEKEAFWAAAAKIALKGGTKVFGRSGGRKLATGVAKTGRFAKGFIRKPSGMRATEKWKNRTVSQKIFGRSAPLANAVGRGGVGAAKAIPGLIGTVGKGALWTGKQFLSKNPIRSIGAWGTAGTIAAVSGSKQNTMTFK